MASVSYRCWRSNSTGSVRTEFLIGTVFWVPLKTRGFWSPFRGSTQAVAARLRVGSDEAAHAVARACQSMRLGLSRSCLLTTGPCHRLVGHRFVPCRFPVPVFDERLFDQKYIFRINPN